MARLKRALVVLEVTYDADRFDHPRDWDWHHGIEPFKEPERLALLCSADLPPTRTSEEARA